MTAKRQASNRESIPAKLYVAALAHRLFWMVVLAWFATASWFAAANLLQGGSDEPVLLQPLVMAIGAAGTAAMFAAILVRDMLRGRGSARVWQALKGSRRERVNYFLAYDLGGAWNSVVSDGRLKSRWRLLNIRWITIPLITLAVIAMFRTSDLLGWMGFAAVLFTVCGTVIIASALWRPEPEFREEVSQ